jgi:hypothetical protein
VSLPAVDLDSASEQLGSTRAGPSHRAPNASARSPAALNRGATAWPPRAAPPCPARPRGARGSAPAHRGQSPGAVHDARSRAPLPPAPPGSRPRRARPGSRGRRWACWRRPGRGGRARAPGRVGRSGGGVRRHAARLRTSDPSRVACCIRTSRARPAPSRPRRHSSSCCPPFPTLRCRCHVRAGEPSGTR